MDGMHSPSVKQDVRVQMLCAWQDGSEDAVMMHFEGWFGSFRSFWCILTHTPPQLRQLLQSNGEFLVCR
jgi:hypothetical protein